MLKMVHNGLCEHEKHETICVSKIKVNLYIMIPGEKPGLESWDTVQFGFPHQELHSSKTCVQNSTSD